MAQESGEIKGSGIVEDELSTEIKKSAGDLNKEISGMDKISEVEIVNGSGKMSVTGAENNIVGAEEGSSAVESGSQVPVVQDNKKTSELGSVPENLKMGTDEDPAIPVSKEDSKMASSNAVPVIPESKADVSLEPEKDTSHSPKDTISGTVKENNVKEAPTDLGLKAFAELNTQSQVLNDSSPQTLPSPGLTGPDPDESDDEVEKSTVQAAEEPARGETMMEGAWADILGSGQLKKKTLKRGKEKERPQSGDAVKIKFSGKLADGSVIDSNEDFEFVLGDSEVIHAFDLIVALMELGEVCQVETAARFAYGDIGLPPLIPPNATILYEIELLSYRPEEAPDSLPLETRQKIGNTKRERGNWWYSRNEYSKAIICYRRSLDFLDIENESSEDPPEKLQEVLEDRLKVYNNMAAAQIKAEAYDAAIKSLDVVLKCQPSNVKALYRKGKVLAQQGKTSEAIAILKKALTIEPNEKSIKTDLARLETKQKNDRLKESSLYKKMLGTPVSAKKTEEKTGYEKVKLPVPWTLMVGSVIAFAASYLAYKYRYA